ncbi:hypothetical protein C8T65DRAFT_837430 [Cerioporus squamosus]|nr:hypothetical protein C8T65DRAFT_837430 [Cerioporus squamosus]
MVISGTPCRYSARHVALLLQVRLIPRCCGLTACTQSRTPDARRAASAKVTVRRRHFHRLPCLAYRRKTLLGRHLFAMISLAQFNVRSSQVK